ncbi:unnamed protein product [Spirodela intermedia]|uniref:Rubisco LSMT substrate-binding domain-containing protein n=1 Tax=Spirodela intermedia TaxID=51605 RepID=A0A7I8KFD1_SPIIN|nr:unnamed protein product [Spirodela intermedia]
MRILSELFTIAHKGTHMLDSLFCESFFLRPASVRAIFNIMSKEKKKRFYTHGCISQKNPLPFPIIFACLFSFLPFLGCPLDLKFMAHLRDLTNDFFLLDYGFVISSNPHDHVELKYDGVLLDAAAIAAGVPSPSFSSPTEWQREILSQLNLHGDGAFLKVNLGGEEKVDGRLLAAFRAVLSDDREAAQKSDLSTLMSLSAEAPLGASAEGKALRTLIALCVISLQHFPTKIMEDESILKGDISESTRLAVEFRLQKKLMIVDLMRELTRRVKVLPKEAFLNR